MLPWAHHPGQQLSLIDALFVSTSAVCVTGLSTIVVPEVLNFWGQMILLGLIQAGGLGIMTMSAAYLVLLRGQKVGSSSRTALIDTFTPGEGLNLAVILRRITFVTLTAELLGAMLLFYMVDDGRGVGFRLWTSIFHSISAFCNAGFSLYPDNLTPWAGNYGALSVIMALIILGGIGFYVVADVRRYLYRRSRVLTLQTKLVLVMTAVLIVGGAVGIWVAEYPQSFARQGLSLGDSIFQSLFLSVSARTAGFNTISIGSMSDFGLFLIILLMLVGGSPGSCAGGVKTTTAGIALMTLVSHLKGRQDVEMFGRRLPLSLIQQSFIIVMMMMLIVASGFIMIRVGNLVQPGSYESLTPRGDSDAMPLAFECVSAACTVGLSADFTPRVGDLGKIVLILLMFAGRIGPLTLVVALIAQKSSAAYRYPEERVMVG